VTRIIVVGGINMDLHLFGVGPSVGQAPLTAERYMTEPGGKGANVARAAARLGAEVRLIGCVGNDEFGRICLDALADDGVDIDAVVVSSAAPTGFVGIELVDGRHRSLLFAPGANDHLRWTDIAPALADAEVGDILITQTEVHPQAVGELMEFVSGSGLSLFLDPAPPDRVTPQMMRVADVITPDLAEGAQLVGRTASSRVWPTLAAAELITAGAQRVILKAGADGAVLADADGVIRIPTLEIVPVDETGAGDVFIAALAVRRSEGASWEQATSFANVASALSVASPGLLLPERSGIDDALGSLASHADDADGVAAADDRPAR
jgi:ribokinase